jgi:pseudouridine-5'-phosphate glycosidase
VIQVAPEVARALKGREPVVALETTLAAHGFPAGEGIEVALAAEQRVRDGGALPATVGVVDGAVRVGLSPDQLERFTADARKVGPRDLAACVVQGAVGATTVGGTLAACRAAGVGFMGTGGIGGVHRGERLDVSGDLGELARTEALVVCSGAKSFLDVPTTMELLETLGVPVLGYRTDELPLFYAAHGGPPVPARVESPEEAARVARTHWGLRRHTALVLAQPPPESLDVERLVEQALAAAEEEGVSGPDLTPYVLAFLHERSRGETLRVNRELVLANAQLAAEVAVAYARASSTRP